MTAIYLVTFVMSAVLICKWTLSHYDDDDDDDESCTTLFLEWHFLFTYSYVFAVGSVV